MKQFLDDNFKLLGQIIDNANVFIDAFDKNGNVVLWNKAAEEITGYKKDEVIGNSNIMKLLYPDTNYYEKVMNSVGISFKGSYKNVEFTLQTKFGDQRTISWSTIKVKDDEGIELGSFGIGIDVTLRRKAQLKEKAAFTALMKFIRQSEEQIKEHEDKIKGLEKENEALRKRIKSK